MTDLAALTAAVEAGNRTVGAAETQAALDAGIDRKASTWRRRGSSRPPETRTGLPAAGRTAGSSRSDAGEPAQEVNDEAA